MSEGCADKRILQIDQQMTKRDAFETHCIVAGKPAKRSAR